jgi:hypothetical protein
MDLLNSESCFEKREISTSKILIQFSLVKKLCYYNQLDFFV